MQQVMQVSNPAVSLPFMKTRRIILIKSTIEATKINPILKAKIETIKLIAALEFKWPTVKGKKLWKTHIYAMSMPPIAYQLARR